VAIAIYGVIFGSMSDYLAKGEGISGRCLTVGGKTTLHTDSCVTVRLFTTGSERERLSSGWRLVSSLSVAVEIASDKDWQSEGWIERRR
jgi:hypothetical protein